MTFNDFVHRHNLKNKATSIIKIQQVLSSLSLNDVDIHLRDGPLSKGIGIVNLHPSRCNLSVCYINEKYSDNYGCSPPQNQSKFIIKRKKKHFLYSAYKKQGRTNKRDFYCASSSLYTIYLTKVIGIDFKSAVLNLYYQMAEYY